MQIELKPLRCFVAVADELHFHRAAARLNLTHRPYPRRSACLNGCLGSASSNGRRDAWN